MAQLKDSVVQGSLRVTDTTYTTNLNLSSGSASLIVKTDANKNLITGTLAASEIPNLSASKITSDTLSADRIPTLSITGKTNGTLTVARGGTGVTSFTNDFVIVSTGTTQTLVSRGLKVTGNVNAETTITTGTSSILNISPTSTLRLNSASGTSILFLNNGVEKARFNINGNLGLGNASTQSTHKLYVVGDSGFTGKIALGCSESTNTITEKASMAYNSTLKAITFTVA